MKDLPINYEEELARQAAEVGKRISAPSGDVIKITQDKTFAFPDGSKTADPWEAIVLGWNTQHFLYEGRYDPNRVTPPKCFAVGLEPASMVPSVNAPEPQSKTCGTCPMNQFGSDGNGKACKNHRVLAVVPPDADADHPIWLLKISPTACKAWDTYVGRLRSNLNTTPLGVVTRIGFDPNSTFASVRFVYANRKNPSLETTFPRQGEAAERLAVEPDVSSYEAVVANKGKKR